MPCYDPWDVDPPGTPEFESSKAAITPKWERFKHAIDFYYRVEQSRIPAPTEYLSVTANVPGSLDARVFGDDLAVRRMHKKVIHRIALHLACDGAGAADASDVRIWLEHEGERTRDSQLIGYRHVVEWVGYGLRTGILLGAERPRPVAAPTNVPDAAQRAQEWFHTHQLGKWRG